LYDIVKEDDIDYPARLMWIDNIHEYPDADTYAIRLLFVLICSKRVKDIYLVNQDTFSMSYVIALGKNGLKDKIVHLGMGNKNSEDILAAFAYLNSYKEKYNHFPRWMSDFVMNNKGIGAKIASLVLYFAFGQNDTIPVDSHMMKCVLALKWVPEWCHTPDAVRMCLQSWVPKNYWPHVNMVLASLGQLLSSVTKTQQIKGIIEWDIMTYQLIMPLVAPILKAYQLTIPSDTQDIFARRLACCIFEGSNILRYHTF